MTVVDHPVSANSVAAKARIRAAALVVVGLAAAGAVLGGLWAWLAPPAHAIIGLPKSGDRVHAYLGNEADHFFVAAFMMLGMVTALAVVGAVLVWQWRTQRGPVMAAGVSLGAMAAALAASGVGALLVRQRYPAVSIDTAPVTPEHRVYYFTEAPSPFFGHTPLQMAVGVLVPAAAGALVYALLAVATERDDLGGWPPQETLRVVPAPLHVAVTEPAAAPVTGDGAPPPVP